MKTWVELFRQNTYTKQDLQDIVELCKQEKGSLAPLFGLAYVDNRPLDKAEIKHGKELWKDMIIDDNVKRVNEKIRGDLKQIKENA